MPGIIYRVIDDATSDVLGDFTNPTDVLDYCFNNGRYISIQDVLKDLIVVRTVAVSSLMPYTAPV